MAARVEKFEEVRDQFVAQWGALGTAWGINRSMAQLHARLLVASGPMSAEELMEELALSRGNVSTNLRELIGWGLVRQVALRGERRQYFEAEQQLWRIICAVARERKRRELEPALVMLRDVAARTKKMKGAEARSFHRQVAALASWIDRVCGLIDRVVAREESQVMPALLRMFG